MTHLSMEQLVGLREPTQDAGLVEARAHLNDCPACQAELEALHQRAARLRALPALRPARSQWGAVAARLDAEKRQRRRRYVAIAGLGLAASIAALVVVKDLARPHKADASEAIAQAMDRSHTLERTLERYHADERVVDGLTAGVAQRLEDRIGVIDQQIQAAQLVTKADQQQQMMLNLWQERIGLLDALVDVHVTRATNVGL
ncbi:MAG TPA: hypothetical protein VJN95_14200 [Gemmatimonadales bacterium]|nr:hypothetical protein [Gemmatimonadales bacterium]